jgi:hypothetical protein
MRRLSLIEQDGGFILESRKEVRIVNKKVKALLMTLYDLITISMVIIGLCYAFGNRVPLWLGIVAFIWLFVDMTVGIYKINSRSCNYDK